MVEEDILEAIKRKLSAVEPDGNIATGEVLSAGEQIAFQNCLLNHPDAPVVMRILARRMHFSTKGSNVLELMERNMFLEILTMCGIQEDDIIESIVSIERRRTSGA